MDMEKACEFWKDEKVVTHYDNFKIDKFWEEVIVAKLIQNVLQKNYLVKRKGKSQQQQKITGENKTGELPKNKKIGRG